MAVIGVKSITGITSITNAAGAADVLTFHSNNTTERVRIDSSGRLLLGTATEGHADADDLTVSSSGRTGITIRSASDNYGNIFFSDATSGTAEHQGIFQYYHADDAFIWKSGSSATERLRISSVGIITSYATHPQILLEDPDGRKVSLRAPSTSNLAALGTDSNHALTFYTNGYSNERLRITSAGSVGINETSPDRKLHVRSDGAAAAKLGGESGSAYYMEIGQLASSGSPGFNATGSSTSMLFQLNGSEKVRIDSSGRLLIGRTSAYAHVDADNLIVGNEATNEHQGITILSHSGKYGGIYFGDGHNPSGHNRCKIIYDHPNDALRIGTAGNAATQFYLNASGHMGLGISPSDIDSIGRSLNIASSTGGAIYLQDTDAPTSKFAAISYNGGTAALQIHAHHSSSYIDLGTNGTGRIYIANDGAVNIGTNFAGYSIWNTLAADQNVKLQVRTTVGEPAGIAILQERGDSNGANLIIGKSRGGSGAGAITSGDQLGWVKWAGADGTRQHNAAGILAWNNGTIATGRVAGNLSFYTSPDAVGSLAERMRISSAGYVTTSQNPKFWYSALTNSSSSGATSSTEILLFATERHNQGSNYNASNGRFTAPVAGTYHFSFNGLVDNSGSNSHYWAQLWRNGSNIGPSIAYTFSNNGEYTNFSGSACIYLAKDDYAQIYASANIHTGNETSFSGHLIG